MNYALSLAAGIDIPIVSLQANLHQPTIKEIAYIGEEEYFRAIQLLCFEKNVIMAMNPQGALGLKDLNNFQIFMTLVTDPSTQDTNNKQNIILSVFTVLFPDYTAQFLPKGIYFFNEKTKHSFTLNETNFEFLQKVLADVAGMNNTSGQNSNFKPKGNLAAKIAAKLMKGRQKVADSQGQASKGVLSRYISILTVGLESMSLNDCLNLTVYQLYDLIERYGLYVGWDLDIKSRLAGGKPDSKPDDWMKDIH